MDFIHNHRQLFKSFVFQTFPAKFILVPSATRLKMSLTKSDHVTKRNGGSGDENAPSSSHKILERVS